MTLLLLAPLIAIAALGGVSLLLRSQRISQRQLVGRLVDPRPYAHDSPSILYFTGESCTICHTAQRPALDALEQRIAHRVSVREIDILREPDLTRRYRVMSLPTTIVIAADGRIAAVNAGFASADRLLGQLAEAGLLVAA
jgi:thioredoxin 1